MFYHCFFFSSRRRHTRWTGDWSSDVCSSDLSACTRQSSAGAGIDTSSWIKRRPEMLAENRANLKWGKNQKDRKSTRLNSSHPSISYAVFCLKKKKKKKKNKKEKNK